jgi:hypothetical protein
VAGVEFDAASGRFLLGFAGVAEFEAAGDFAVLEEEAAADGVPDDEALVLVGGCARLRG